MELLNYLLEILTVFLFGPEIEGVTYAVAPVLIGLGAGLAAGGLNYALGTGERRRLRRKSNRAESRLNEGLSNTDQSIQRVLGKAESIDTDQSVDDLYGKQIGDLSDKVIAGQGATASALSRTGMAKGGDATGELNVALQRLTEGSNRSIMDIVNEYSERTDQFNLNQQSLKNSMLQNVMGARGGMLSTLAGQAQHAQSQDVMKRQADKQFFLDAIGTGASAGASANGGGAG